MEHTPSVQAESRDLPPTAPVTPPKEADMPTVLTESTDTDTEVPGGKWSLIAMAKVSALLQGPCSYSVTAYATVIGGPGLRPLPGSDRGHEEGVPGPPDGRRGDR